MTSKIVVNNIGADAGIASVHFDSNVQRGSSNLHSTGLTVGNNFLHTTGINVGTGATIHVPATNVLTFGTNSNERLRIFSNGLVNIGAGSSTSGLSPLLHLHKNASNSSAYFHITNNDTGITNNDGFLLGINPSGDCLVFNKDSTPIRFATAGIERARFLSGGEFAIGGSGYGGQPFSLQTSSTNLGYMETTSTTRGVMSFRDGNSTQNVGFGCIGNNHFFMKDGNEKVRIDSSGRLLIGTTTEGHPAGDNLTVADSGHAGITIRSGTTSNGALYFSDGTSGSDEYRGGVVYHHDGNYMRFYTNGTERIRIDSSGTFHVKTNGMNLENATATNSRGYSITNAAGTTGWTFGNGITASSHQYVIYDNTAGSARFQINGNGAFGLNGGNYGAAREVMVSNGSGSAVSWSANPFVIDMASLGDLDPGKLFVRYREVNVTGNGLVYLEICKSTTNCGPGRSGYPIGFVPGVVYNSQFRVDKVGITPWPNGSGHRYEFFAIISDFVASGKLGIYYLTNTTS